MAPKDSRMRVAVAGTNELALRIADAVRNETSYQLIILSRGLHPHLPYSRYPVHTVDYDSQESLTHAVMGVDTIISTITGYPQLELLKAAVAVNVRRFAPAEFEGSIGARPVVDELDRGKTNIRSWLEHYRVQNLIETTVFTCGVLYERFSPGGLKAKRLGMQIDYGSEGDFLVNVRNLDATPITGDHGDVSLCMTASHDVARLVVQAMGMDSWPEELSMVGEKLTVGEILRIVQRVRDTKMRASRILRPIDLRIDIATAKAMDDDAARACALEHLATLDGRYLFHRPGNLREMNRGYKMVKFESWLENEWRNIPVEDD